jgi:methyltransferase family protein
MLELAPEALGALTDPALEPLFLRPSRIGPDSAWYGHLPFAAWIMRAARPSQFVELGTHAGISYAGFCDAVLACHLPTRCLAVDTWQGDEHAGFYGETVFADLSRFHDRRYGAFSRLLRCRFDQALDTLPDGSIDLLHIDGRHLLRDITEDFNSWLPKLSPQAVVLLHDTNVRERDFGVWQFWDRHRTLYPSFEFRRSRCWNFADFPRPKRPGCCASASHSPANAGRRNTR